MDLRSAVKKLGPWAIIEYLINPLLSLAIAPIIIKKLGLGIYGEWALIIALLSLSVSFVSGISLSISQYISNNYQKNLYQQLNSQLDAIKLTLIISIFTSISTLIILTFQNVNIMFFLYIAIIIVESLDSIFSGILRGKLLIKLLVHIEAFARIIQFLSIIISINYFNTVNGIAIGYLFGSSVKLVFRYYMNEINFKFIISHKFSKNSAIIKGSGWATIQNLGGALYNSLDKLLISHFFGTDILAFYSLASQIPNQIQAVFSAGLSVQINAVSRYVSENSRRTLYVHYIKDLKIVVLISIFIYLLFFISSNFIFKLWLGKNNFYEIMPYLLPAIFIAFTQTISIPGYFMTIGIGDIKYAAIVSIIASVVALLFLFISSNFISPQYAILSKSLYGVIVFLLIGKGMRKLLVIK
ncbi:MATE family efflux transporter [Polynucleobacter yangtzensis]|uniref:MATE family efflux transporter n=1 Tax=Polynucleobacter yangtzensis TaxID=1743159 RepID=UPI00082D47D7|nr:MATE family efflux transporter [Polynucleobacter yangtzensis]